ncbi:hypothetical protein M426DRAFT_259629 [Hypoxylon sp. CI-4A]|nr:hypothetical protein M426DRAFT_259629 [Hypoxylon sp. CI-4A]
MVSVPSANLPIHMLHRWDPVFNSRRDLDVNHDDPYVDIKNDNNTSLDTVELFMQASEETDLCRYATDMVVGFCKGVDLQGLEHDPHASTDLVALLDGSGGLTAWGLYGALKGFKGHERRDETSSSRLTKSDITKDSAVHRLYIANLNPWSVFSLAATAPNDQAAFLSEFIFNHLQLSPLVNARISHTGVPVFALEFHLPYFALRKHRLAQGDHRKINNGKQLRRYQDIGFLRTMEAKSDNSHTEYIYEGNLSCLICGSSRYSWSAYLFNDIYFETEDDEESITEYQMQEREGLMPDPLFAGKRTRDKWPCEPREHFLLVYEVRLRHVKKEWHQLIETVDEAIHLYRDDYWNKVIGGASLDSSDPGVRTHATKRRPQLREEIKDPDHLARLQRSLAAVDQQVTDLRRLLTKVKHLMNISDDISRHLALPPTLAAAFLSTQEGYIPITPSPRALFIIVVALEALVWMILGSLLGWDWFWAKVKHRLYQLSMSQRRVGGPEIQQSEGLG